jgi:hypothetical protein
MLVMNAIDKYLIKITNQLYIWKAYRILIFYPILLQFFFFKCIVLRASAGVYEFPLSLWFPK